MDLYASEDVTSSTTAQVITEQSYLEDSIVEAPPLLSLQSYLNHAGIDEPSPLLERQYLIHTQTLNDMDEAYIDAWELLRAQPQINELMKRYRLMRADLNISVQISAPVTTYGMLFCVPLYNFTQGIATNRGMDWRHLICAPDAVLLDVSRRERVEITIPYVSPFDYQAVHEVQAGLDRMSPLNVLFVTVQNLRSIQPDVPSPYAKLQIWANYSNVSLAGPMYADGQMMSMPQKAHTVLKQIGTTLEVMGGLASTYGVPGAAELNYAQQAVKDMGTFTGQLDTVVRSIQDITGTTGENNEPEPYRLAPWGDLVSPTYTATQQFMGATKISSLPGIPLEGPTQDFDLYSIARLQCWQYNDIMGPGGSVVESIHPVNMVGWFPAVVDLFRRYRCSYKVHLRFATSPLVTGRAIVTVHWGPLGSLSQPGDTYTQVVSIQGTVDHYFTIPYVNVNHWHGTGNESTTYNNYLNPRVRVELPELTSSSEPTTSSVALLVMVSPADDLVMQYPQSPFVDEQSLVAEGQMNMSTLHSNQSMFPSVSGSLPPVTDAADVTHLMDLLNRYSTSDPRWFSVDNYTQGISYLLPFIPNDLPLGTFDWLVNLFARYTSGSRRFKVEMSADAEDLVMMNSWTAAKYGDVTTDFYYRPFDGITRTYSGVWQILEFEVPYTYPFTMRPVWEDPSVLTNPSCNKQILRIAPIGGVRDPTLVTSPDNVVKAFVSAGHDFKLHILSPPPRYMLVGLTPPL